MAKSPADDPKPRKRDKAVARLTDLRDTADRTARETVRSLEANPMSVLVGGITVGLLAGALIPRSQREIAALAPIGKRIADGAAAAVTAAKETGKEQLSAGMLSRDAAKESARKVFASVVEAAKGGGAATSPTSGQ